MNAYYRHHGKRGGPFLTTRHDSLRAAKLDEPGYVWAASGDGETWYGYESRKDMRADENGSKPWLVATTISVVTP